MALDALLAKLEGRAVTSVTSGPTSNVTPKSAPVLACTSVTSVTAENDDTASKAASEPLSDSKMEARRQRVLAMLETSPGIKYAFIDNMDSDPDPVLLTLAIRGKATCELRIPRDKYEPFLLMTLIDRHGGTIH